MATGGIERRLAAILAADVVGYSRLMERDEAGTFERLKRLRAEVVEPVLARHGGRFVDLKGDGAIVEFQSAVAAVEAAAEIQREMQARDPDLPEGERVRYRIGINLGEVIVDEDTIYGDGVNVAARIEGLCEPGGVWLSRSVHDQVRGKLDLALVPSGLHQVKNISAAVEIFRVALDGVAPPAPPRSGLRTRARRWLPFAAAAVLLAAVLAAGVWRFWPGGPPNERPSIAVLPLDNLSGDERTGRLADGITEDVITDLARFRYLDVIARNSVEAYKGKPVDVRQVGRDLGVRYVLEGSLQADPERARVTMQLIDAATGAHLWSERYDRPPALLLQTRDEVTAQIAATLTGQHGPLAAAGEEVARRKPPGSLAAYEHLLLAGAAYGSRDKAGTAEARRLLEKALEVDPGYARAWTFLA